MKRYLLVSSVTKNTTVTIKRDSNIIEIQYNKSRKRNRRKKKRRNKKKPSRKNNSRRRC